MEENGEGVKKRGGREKRNLSISRDRAPLAEFLGEVWRRACPMRARQRARVKKLWLAPGPASLALPVTDDYIE